MNPVIQIDVKMGAILTTVVGVGRTVALVTAEDGTCNGQETHQRYRITQTELIYPEDISPVSII